MRLLAAAALAAALAVPATATASSPESGEVSKDKLVQKWTGQVTSTFVHLLVPNYQRTRCDAPFCDQITLQVKDTGTLTLHLSAPDSASFVDMRVTKPDGEILVFDGNAEETTNTQVFEAAETGTWKVAIFDNSLYGLDAGDYSGRATLVLPPAATE